MMRFLPAIYPSAHSKRNATAPPTMAATTTCGDKNIEPSTLVVGHRRSASFRQSRISCRCFSKAFRLASKARSIGIIDELVGD
jgi:hypothetical protein